MRRAVFLVLLAFTACRRHEVDHEKDDDKKKEGAHTGDTLTARSAAEEAIHAYESAATCDVRAQTIVFPANNRDRLFKNGCAAHRVERFETRDCDALQGALTQCIATARRDGDKARYFLVKQPNGTFLVDSRATERPSGIPEFRAHLPTTPTILRIRARTTGTYGNIFRGKQKTHFALRFRGPEGDPSDAAYWGYAYVPRDSADGKMLQATLESNDYTNLTVALLYTSSDPDAALVAKVISTDYFETDAEHAYEASLRDGGP